MKFLDIAYVITEFGQVLKKHSCYSPDVVRAAVREIEKMVNDQDLDILGSLSKGLFYRNFAHFIRNGLDVDDSVDRSKVCHDFAYWLFVKMKDFSNITFHTWKMIINVKGESGPREVVVLTDNIDLISDTIFFGKTLFDEDFTCTLEHVINAFADVMDEEYSKRRDMVTTMHALYDTIELGVYMPIVGYGHLPTVKFKHEPYSF